MPKRKENLGQPDIELTAYKILLQRHLNDDRLLGERSSIFLASSSILFLGFVTLPQAAVEFRIFIALLGIALCFFVIFSNLRTKIGLDFWEKAEKIIEDETSGFDYMRKKSILPQLVYEETKKYRIGRLLSRMRNRLIFTYYLPSTFLTLWAGSIFWVLIN
jgi:hypothetical protein